jgi:glucuronoarabinoxylan endo-1,4-beta-xylanase
LPIRLIGILLFCACTKKGADTNEEKKPETVEAVVSILSESHQVIRGFGCATVFAPPNTPELTNSDYDKLFGAGNAQIGLNLLRIRIASDDAWRQVELQHAKGAIQRGAQVIASPWSPPARMKTNGSIIGGKLIPDSAAAYARYLNSFAAFMAANAAPLYAVSVQNEPDWEPSYESCTWSATEMRDFLKNQGALITATRLIAPELVNNNQGYVNTILADDGAIANLDILGTHLYGGGIIENETAKARGLEVWMTEHLDTNITYAASLATAVEIHDCFTKAGFNAYIWWYGKRFYGLIGQDGEITKRGYIVAQFARFLREGATRISTSTNSRSDVLISAYRRTNNKRVVIAINTGANNVKQTVNLAGTSAGTVVPYQTDESKNTEQGSAINITNESVVYTIPPLSIVTFVEQ